MHHSILWYSDHVHVPEYHFSSFKGEQPGPTYYLSPANIYGLGIHYAFNNICSVYTCTQFEGKKVMNNIASWLLCWLNEKECYSREYSKNHKMSEISIFVESCSTQKENNVMIRFIKMTKEGWFFGTDHLHFYIKGHTKNDCDHAFNSLKVLYRKQNVFTFENCCEILNTSNNFEVIKMFYQNFFDLKSFLNDLYGIPYPKTANINHATQF